MTLDLKIIEPSENLKKYINEKSLTFPNLADAYLEISRNVYDLLKEYHSKRGKLMDGYEDLLKLIQCIQKKLTIPSEDEDEDSRGRKTVWENKNFVSNSLGLYINAMQNLRENKINFVIYVILYISVIFISIGGFFFP